MKIQTGFKLSSLLSLFLNSRALMSTMSIMKFFGKKSTRNLAVSSDSIEDGVAVAETIKTVDVTEKSVGKKRSLAIDEVDTLSSVAKKPLSVPSILDRLEDSWKNRLFPESQKPYFKRLESFVKEESSTKTVYPPQEDVFFALQNCPFENVKVVIIGQDPYHGNHFSHLSSPSVIHNF
jgi:hypothetical protein